MIEISRDSPFSYCIFGVHASGRFCYMSRTRTREAADTESRYLFGQGWHDVVIMFDGERVG
jgi:hypothetical protein